ncbi:SRPBCC domain-containing protein [Mucilaginibacter pallidiroseus]|uniref:SRPBCC domain-containing protein n=1 Tax=Mucilaginibacter pallidiroseus TaxID=2599295 RepID=A0A563UJQ9_9SPHI|nr:SRPBCC family protein [Mucilaginibacter pallidiroseus]TWR31612.1 SRPBCC domain-containing protein [Mucilaginibacter pallidiroseus]
MNGLSLKTEVTFNATAAQVWRGLTDPAMVKDYFFGTNLKSDWRVGSPITFSGEWDGTSYEDKGIIKEIEPEKYLSYTYWSSMSGTEETPENYATISYDLDAKDGVTVLTITQDNIKDEAAKQHSEQNWQMLMDAMKKLIELPS